MYGMVLEATYTFFVLIGYSNLVSLMGESVSFSDLQSPSFLGYGEVDKRFGYQSHKPIAVIFMVSSFLDILIHLIFGVLYTYFVLFFWFSIGSGKVQKLFWPNLVDQ